MGEYPARSSAWHLGNKARAGWVLSSRTAGSVTRLHSTYPAGLEAVHVELWLLVGNVFIRTVWNSQLRALREASSSGSWWSLCLLVLFVFLKSVSWNRASAQKGVAKQVLARLQYTCRTCSLSVALFRHLPDYVHLPVEITSSREHSGKSAEFNSLFPEVCYRTHCLVTFHQLIQLTPSNNFLKPIYLKLTFKNDNVGLG